MTSLDDDGYWKIDEKEQSAVPQIEGQGDDKDEQHDDKLQARRCKAGIEPSDRQLRGKDKVKEGSVSKA